jgi:hypothetical protein
MARVYAQRKNLEDVSPDEICCETMRLFFQADVRKYTYLVDTQMVKRRVFECEGCKRRTAEENGIAVVGPPEVAGWVLRPVFYDLNEGSAE